MEARLDSIAVAISELGNQSFWYDILTTIPAAFLAATAAIMAAAATVYFQNRSIRINVEKAIVLEVSAIVGEIERVLKLPGRDSNIVCELVKMRIDSIPVFTGNTQNISLLSEECAVKVFGFYSKFLTIPLNEKNNTFMRKDLTVLEICGKKLIGGGI